MHMCAQLACHVSMMRGYNDVLVSLLPLLDLQHRQDRQLSVRPWVCLPRELASDRAATAVVNGGLGRGVAALRRLLVTELKQHMWRNALQDSATGSRYDVYVSK